MMEHLNTRVILKLWNLKGFILKGLYTMDSEEECAAAVVIIALLSKRKKRRRNRSTWVKPWLSSSLHALIKISVDSVFCALVAILKII